jgi:leader peptidase (prepilin peptidase) / N-methyltransferase
VHDAIQPNWLPFTLMNALPVFLIGLCLGSFLNVVIYRAPRGLSIVYPPSRCPSCDRSIRWFHNVPLFGWLCLRGRCADCGNRISPRYPLVELVGGLLTLVAAFAFPDPLRSLGALWLFLSLWATLWIDLEHRIILDEISLGGTALGLLLAHWTIGLTSSVLGAAAGAGGLFLVGWIYQRLRGRPGMGMGDVKLAAMLGSFLGLTGIVLTVLLASFLGSILGIILVWRRRGSGLTALPFGSFLAPAAIIALVWGPRIWAWYSGFFPSR